MRFTFVFKLSVRVLAAGFVFAALSAPAGAQETAASVPIQVAQAESAGRVGDDRLATLGDLRHMGGRTDAQISELRSEMRDIRGEMQAIREEMGRMFYALLAAMIALFGLPHLPTWWRQLRANGKSAA